jgi:hypothetical protein
MFKRKPAGVFVLGAGPTGLLAAHAAQSKGYNVTVFSKPDPRTNEAAKSELFGCQYLHAYIPELGMMDESGHHVRYLLDGPVDGYRRKVYGESWQGSVSPDEYGPEDSHMAWDLREAYDRLWERWHRSIVPMSIGPAQVENMLAVEPLIVVLNTIPAPSVCRDKQAHKFLVQNVYAMGTKDVTMAQARLPYYAPNMTVQCNGWRDTGWYRAATVFGYSTLEWPEGKRPPIEGVVPVSKPLSTDCTCWPSNRMHRLGRYGRWTKGVLVHTAYFDTLKVLP